MFRYFTLAGAVILMAAAPFANAIAESAPTNWRTSLDKSVLPELNRVLAEPIVAFAIEAQNARYAGLAQADIDALDAQWRKEHETEAQPLISAILSNPVSSYLTRVQAQSIGLYTEIFVMDDHGLNVGQSNISSDFWQGDEAKWQKTFQVGPRAVFIDEPEFRDDVGIWVVQVNLAIGSADASIGAATFEVNLTELDRRRPKG